MKARVKPLLEDGVRGQEIARLVKLDTSTICLVTIRPRPRQVALPSRLISRNL